MKVQILRNILSTSDPEHEWVECGDLPFRVSHKDEESRSREIIDFVVHVTGGRLDLVGRTNVPVVISWARNQ